MRLRFAIALIPLLASGNLASAAATLTSPWIVDPENGHSYALTINTDWVRAEVAAIKNGGHLATIRNQADQDFVYQTFGDYGGQSRLLWIGLNDSATAGNYRWTSGAPVTYMNWASGEPNGAATNERFVAMYYPGHSEQEEWNDWGHGQSDPIGLPFNGVVERDPANPVNYPVQIATSPNWLTLAPVGSQIGQGIDSVGLAFEAAHPEWNTNASYDTAGWSAAQLAYPNLDKDYIWGAPSAAPVYFRHTFTLAGPVTDATLFTRLTILHWSISTAIW